MVRSSVDYATDQITVYRYCRYNCAYCWAWRVPLFRKRIEKGRYDPVEEGKKYLRIKEKRVIVVSFTSDPYPPITNFAERLLTRRVLEVLCRAKQHRVLILTKNPILAVIRDLDLMLTHGDMWLGTTITTLDGKVAEKLEPKAPLPQYRLEALKVAHEKGVKTWVSIEPIIPYITYPEDIIEATKDFVDWYVLGSYNYCSRIKLPKVNRYIPENGRFTKRELTVWYNMHVREAIELLKKHSKPFFIKKELKKHLKVQGP